MPKYEVLVEARIKKWYRVEADSPEAAAEYAEEMFTPETQPDVLERYDQETISVTRVRR